MILGFTEYEDSCSAARLRFEVIMLGFFKIEDLRRVVSVHTGLKHKIVVPHWGPA